MSREADLAGVLSADSTLTGILTGGIYQAGLVGLEGINRKSTPGAFTVGGALQPCALVKQRGNVVDYLLSDEAAQLASATQVVEVWLYEDRTYTAIQAAMNRIYALLQGRLFTNAFPLELGLIVDRQRDVGALANASLARMDWTVRSILQPE